MRMMTIMMVMTMIGMVIMIIMTYFAVESNFPRADANEHVSIEN